MTLLCGRQPTPRPPATGRPGGSPLLLALRRLHRGLLYPLLAVLLPARCFGCGRLLGPVHLFGGCPDCWSDLRPIRGPCCPGCGIPLPPGTDLLGPAGGRCGRCLLRPTGLDGARAAVVYDSLARRFVLRGKLAGRRELLLALGAQVAGLLAAVRFGAGCSVVVPVPSHPWIRAKRGFNPAEEIARPVAATLGLPLKARLLARRFRRHGAAKGLRAAGRRRLLGGAFRVRRPVSGERVLLVDDVLTTGATAEACARALREAGAERVRVAAWARTPLLGAGSGGVTRFDRVERPNL